MRLISENKAIRTAPHGASCLGQHKMYLGVACPSCGTDIPFGPYTFAEHARLFGGPVNEPATRGPRPEHVAAQEAYLFADRERTKAYGEVVRLEDELARAQMSTSEVTVSGGVRNQAPDPQKVARLTEKLAAAREARETADDRTSKALRTSNRIKARWPSRKPKNPPPFPNPERPWPGERRPTPGGAVRATRIRGTRS